MYRPCQLEARVGIDPGRDAVIRKMARVLETEGFTTGPGWKYSPALDHGEAKSLEIKPDFWVVLAIKDRMIPHAVEYADGNTDLLDALKPAGRYRHEADRMSKYGREPRCFLWVVCETENIRENVESAGIHLPMLTTTSALFNRGPHRGAEAIWRYAGEWVPADHLTRQEFEWKAFEEVKSTPWSEWGFPNQRQLLEELAGQMASGGYETDVVIRYLAHPGGSNPSGTTVEIRAYVKVGGAGNYELVYVQCESDLPISPGPRAIGGSSQPDILATRNLVICRDQDVEKALKGPLASRPALATSRDELLRGPHHGPASVWRYHGRTVNIDHLEGVVVCPEPQPSREEEPVESPESPRPESPPERLADEKRPNWLGRVLGS